MPSRKGRHKDLILLTDMDSRDTQSLLTILCKLWIQRHFFTPSCRRERRHHTCLLTGRRQRSVGHMHARGTTRTLTGDVSSELHLGKISLSRAGVVTLLMPNQLMRRTQWAILCTAYPLGRTVFTPTQKCCLKQQQKFPFLLNNTLCSTQHLTSVSCTLI